MLEASKQALVVGATGKEEGSNAPSASCVQLLKVSLLLHKPPASIHTLARVPPPHRRTKKPPLPAHTHWQVAPRLESVSYSLYWRDTLHVSTACLADVPLERLLAPSGGGDSPADPTAALEGMTGAQLLARVAEHLGWPPVERLQRLDGFELPWQRLLIRCAGACAHLDAQLPPALVQRVLRIQRLPPSGPLAARRDTRLFLQGP